MTFSKRTILMYSATNRSMRPLLLCVSILLVAITSRSQEVSAVPLDEATLRALQAAADSAQAPHYRTREPMRSHGNPHPSPRVGDAKEDTTEPLPLGIGGAVSPDKTTRGGTSW